MNQKIISVALLACVSGMTHIAVHFAVAAPQEPNPSVEHDEPHHTPLEELQVVSGVVASWTTNKGGDVDGFKVGDNVAVHFPPHHGEQISAWLKLQDDVTVFAKPKSRPDGSETMEAVVLQRGEGAMQIPGPKPHHPKQNHGNPHGGKPRPVHAGDRGEPLMSVRGKVTELHENREGIVDGFKVDAKTEVKFPPHQSKAILAMIHVGSDVAVDGRRHETPKGDTHLHADRVSSGSAVIEIDRPETGKHDGPPPHVQIVDELRKIREVLGEQGSR